MYRNEDSMTRKGRITRCVTALAGSAYLAGVLLGVPLVLTACDKETSSSKTTTTRTTETPEGTKKTTETVEKKVETEHKTPPK
jgi:hypothetical protein